MSNTVENDDIDDLDFEGTATEPVQKVAPSQEPPVQTEVKPEDPVQKALAELAGHVKSLAPAPKGDEKPKMTPEEEAKYWGVYNPTQSRPDFFKKFFNLGDDADDLTLKERQELFADMQRGLTVQSLTGARNMMLQMRQELEQQYAPLMEFYQQQQAKEIRETFNTKYPALSDPKFQGLLAAKAAALQGQNFSSREDYFKVLAESTAKDIKALVPDFDLGAAPVQPTKSSGTAPRTPRTSVGGSGGANGGAARTPAKATALDEIFS